jgi:DNA-binding MarR family transcriptional regulator
MDRTTLTAALKPLVRRGLVTISVDKKDRRSRLLTIRPAGRALLAKAFPIWRQTHVELEGHISQPEGLRAALLALAWD